MVGWGGGGDSDCDGGFGGGSKIQFTKTRSPPLPTRPSPDSVGPSRHLVKVSL